MTKYNEFIKRGTRYMSRTMIEFRTRLVGASQLIIDFYYCSLALALLQPDVKYESLISIKILKIQKINSNSFIVLF